MGGRERRVRAARRGDAGDTGTMGLGPAVCSMNKGGTEYPVRGLTHRQACGGNDQAHEAREDGTLSPCPRPRAHASGHRWHRTTRHLAFPAGLSPGPQMAALPRSCSPGGGNSAVAVTKGNRSPQKTSRADGDICQLPLGRVALLLGAGVSWRRKEQRPGSGAPCSLCPLRLQARQPPEAATSAHCTPRDPHPHGGTGPLAPWLSQTTTWEALHLSPPSQVL